eukprot:NODE_944_length_1214_cov_94.877253_g711_i0.p1 GENE.NODE_944_length_1214_cov_94.877253_g711_i0~~NODE_944_length_1214_cov_94.877253_g711_i0.p1  ORF type:complete len:240 (-),score=54.13 NODE_944_length_1214_cov_94.877253_g711_i0:151-870(-)
MEKEDMGRLLRENNGEVKLCRCWKSKAWPLCDGAHVAHNKESGDNAGPLVIRSTAGADGQWQWRRRMGVHYAYHQSPGNELVHLLMIPLELFAFILLFSCVPMPPGTWDLAKLVILGLAPIYLLTEVLCGGLFVALLFGLRAAALSLPTTDPLVRLGVAVAAFVVPFVVQTQIGHRCLEPKGRDDTQKNVAEFTLTHNPIPLLLIFYYHLVALLFQLGYRPALRKQIATHTQAECKKFV